MRRSRALAASRVGTPCVHAVTGTEARRQFELAVIEVTPGGLVQYRTYHLGHHKFAQQAEDPDLGLSAPFPITRLSLRRKIVRDLTGWLMIGIGRDPLSLTPEERVLEAYYERFTAYAVDKSRVIVVEFQSRKLCSHGRKTERSCSLPCMLMPRICPVPLSRL